MTDWSRVPITDGTAQRDRQPPAFEPDYFNVDELSFEDLLAMGADIAAGMRYYNLANDVDGDWAPLFEADEAVNMAQLLSVDLVRIEAEFRQIASRNPQDSCLFILNLADRINRWFKRLGASRHASAELLARKMATIIGDKLTPELHNLCRIAWRDEAYRTRADFSSFDRIWAIGDPQSENPFPASDIDDQQTTAELVRHLGDSFYAFTNAISLFKKTAAMVLQQSLESEQHDPAMGLFMVFLQLYQKAQHRLNRFTHRHLDFYYRRVLEIDNKDAEPERCYLLCEPRPGSGKTLVIKDTRFSAGKDALRNEMIYAADEDLLVRDVRLEALATLFLQHDKLISPEAELGLVTRLKMGRPAIPSNPEDWAGAQANPPPWSLFGADQSTEGPGMVRDARMGFCFASPVLLLAEGTRKIELSIELDPITAAGIECQVQELLDCRSAVAFFDQFHDLFLLYLLNFKGQLLSTYMEKIKLKASSLSIDQDYRWKKIESLLGDDWQWLFYTLFKQVFLLKLTTSDGWLEVDNYSVAPYDQTESSEHIGLTISFCLGADVVPISAYDADLHGGQLQTDLPVLQCELNSQSHFCPYSIFQRLPVESINIDAEVSGVRDLLVYNQHGQLDPSKPFQPFGPVPGGNSFLVFGSYELARKRLRQLQIDLEWAELPVHSGGFEEYYHGYSNAYDSSMFRGEFRILSNSQWMPNDPLVRIRFNLFDSTEVGSRVAAKKRLRIDRLDAARSIDASVPAAQYNYDLKAKNGFYRIALVEPETAFGHGEYPQLLSSVLAANARRKKNLQAVPNTPYTPVLNGISLSYRASSTIYPSRQNSRGDSTEDKLFHLHPFGVETVFPSETGKPCCLMPQYRDEGNLFIGLAGDTIAGPLSLLFHLSQDAAQGELAQQANCNWFYLAGANQWKKLPPERLLSDSTHGFLTSGKVTLTVPADIDRGSSIMPGNCYWLRASVTQAASSFAGCHSIHLNAVRVSHRSGDIDSGNAESARARNWASLQPLVGIGSIRQAYAAFGGRLRENDSAYKVRVAERLRHKNRALLPRDYEQLVLEQFPEIEKVKCFNSTSSREDAIIPGRVLIVVVPGGSKLAGACARAKVSIRKLDQIGAYLKTLSPEFVQIEVRNPLYERVQVRCRVKFIDTASAGVNLNRLNQHISDYICPWKAPGYEARFGWRIRQRDVESYIRDLDYIEFVTDFSMLHITVDNHGNYRLHDSASGEQNRDATIKPRYPWSLAIPEDQHYIEISPGMEPKTAELTTYGELAIGSTLIISGK